MKCYRKVSVDDDYEGKRVSLYVCIVCVRTCQCASISVPFLKISLIQYNKIVYDS